MPAYLVQINPSAAPLVNGALNAVVFAEDAAKAKLAATSLFNNAGQGAPAPYYLDLWNAATVTEIVAGDLENSVLRVTVSATTPIDISITGGAAATVDSMCASMVTELNNDAQIANASYSAGNLLTVAAIADNLGDKTVTCSWILDGVDTGLVGTITHEGIAAADLTVQMATDAIALPNAIAAW